MILSVYFVMTSVFFMGGLLIFLLVGEGFFLLWVSLEFLTWSLLPLMILKKSVTTVEGVLKYFIIQSMASLTWVLGSLFWGEELFFQKSGFYENISMFLCLLAMFLKMGIFPFHSWVMELIVSSEIAVISFLLIPQKIIPLLIILNTLLLSDGGVFFKLGILVPIFLFCCYSLSNFNKIFSLLFISSMYHSGLMFLLMSWGGNLELIFWYFLTYSFFFLICSWSCSILNYENKMQNFSSKKSSLFIIFMGMSGLPPFLMFSLKILFMSVIGWGDLFIYTLVIIMTFYIFSFLSVFLESMSSMSITSGKYFPQNIVSVNMLMWMSVITMPLLLLFF